MSHGLVAHICNLNLRLTYHGLKFLKKCGLFTSFEFDNHQSEQVDGVGLGSKMHVLCLKVFENLAWLTSITSRV